MVDVICDTSFLIHIANTRIKNIANIETDIGQLSYVVPTIVIEELEHLAKDPKKMAGAKSALRYVENLKQIELVGSYADDAISGHIKSKKGMAATMDKALKHKIKDSGGSVISIANDRIVLEE